jgi:hypothetical protein
VVPASGFSCVVDPRVAGTGSPGSLGSLPPPVNWGQVEDSAQQACSHVAAADRVLWEVLAMIGRDILHLIQVSLEEN